MNSPELRSFPWTAGSDCAGGDFASEGLEPTGFRVWSFRSIRDSGYVPLSPITALVGRERSGKTTLLLALSGLDPRVAAPYSAAHDWPRAQRPHPNGTQVVCAAKFRLRRSLRDELVNAGRIAPDVTGIHVGRSYSNDFLVSVLDQGGFAGPLRGQTEEWTPVGPELERELLGRIPEFIYAHSGSTLPEKFPSNELEGLLVEGPPATTAGDSTGPEGFGVRALARLAMSGASEEDLAGPWLDRLNSRLNELALSQTLRLSDDRGLIRVLTRQGNGWRPFGSLPLARRFVLTLDLRIAAAREAGDPAPVLLLDAPGRAFKGGLKRQLAGSLARYSSAGIPVVYTARLPFHIELQHPEQVLVLAPDEASRETLCEAPFGAGDLAIQAALGMQGRASFRIDDVNLVVEGPTDAGILRALATRFASFGGPTLAEDLNVISAGGAFEVASVSSFLARQGLGVVALFDSDAAGLAGLRDLEDKALGERLGHSVRPLLLGVAADLEVEGATIEDLFPSTEYVDAIRSIADEPARRLLAELEERMALGHEHHAARWLRRAYASRGWRFPKVEVAQLLEQKVLATESEGDFDPQFLKSIRSLFHQINLNIETLRGGMRTPGSGDA